jgi:stalled ribosome rescue protein Dom34
MTHHFHAVVYMDHAEAVVFEFSHTGDSTDTRIRAEHEHGNIHHKAGSSGSGHSHDSKAYLSAITEALQHSKEVLIVGHGTAKEELAGFIRDHVPALAPRIKGVKTVDHPSKPEILALARKFFEIEDHMTPQI